MKLWSMAIIVLFLFSGCVSKKQYLNLKNKAIQQSQIIQEQQIQIETLKKKRSKQKSYGNYSSSYPDHPKKHIKLKSVEDDNYSAEYMYPTAAKEKTVKQALVEKKTSINSDTLEKTECITMIGQEKFDKYTKMFGNEAASLKRCKMLKAMKQ